VVNNVGLIMTYAYYPQLNRIIWKEKRIG